MYIPGKLRSHTDFNLCDLDARTMEEPIFTTPMHTDFYKFPMAHLLFRNPEYGNKKVTWAFKNRTKGVDLSETVKEDEFMAEWDYVRNMRLCNRERHYLAGTYEYDTRMFTDAFLDELMNLKTPEASFSVTDEKKLDIRATGPWVHSTFSEIAMLKIVNALHYRTQLRKMSRLERYAVYGEGIKRLLETVKLLKANPHVSFSEFGNRRSFSPAWLDAVVGFLLEELPSSQFIGTSNVHLANQHGVEPKGTCAHELSMGLTALMFDGTKESIAKAIRTLHELWWKMYGQGLSIRLPDTYGTPFTMSVLPDSHFRDWKGARIDSADPFVGVQWEIDQYHKLGIDPRGKIAIPSDGLKPELMVQLADRFKGQIKVSFGLGTHLTNNLGMKPLSIVCKPVMIDGKPTVKISDNPEKATGDPATVAAYMAALDYHAQNHKVQEV